MSNTWKHFRRMLTGLLAAALIVTSVPAAAFADNLDVSNGDETQVVDEAAVNTTDTAGTADAKTDGGGTVASSDDDSDNADIKDASADGEEVEQALQEKGPESDEPEDEHFGAAKPDSPGIKQDVYSASLYNDLNKTQPIEANFDVTKGEEYDNDVDITISGVEGKKIKVSKADGTKEEGYWIGVCVPVYDNWFGDSNKEFPVDISRTSTYGEVSTSENSIYYRITDFNDWDEQSFTAHYQDKTGEMEVDIDYNVTIDVDSFDFDGYDMPALDSVMDVKASTTAVSGAQVPGNYKWTSTSEKGKDISVNSIVNITDPVKKSQCELDGALTWGYWSSVAIPSVSVDGKLVSVVEVSNNAAFDEGTVTIPDKISIGGKYYAPVSWNMADDNGIRKPLYARVTYVFDNAGLADWVEYKYDIKFNFATDNGLPDRTFLNGLVGKLKAVPVYKAVSRDAITPYTLTNDGQKTVKVESTGLTLNRTTSGNDYDDEGYKVVLSFDHDEISSNGTLNEVKAGLKGEIPDVVTKGADGKYVFNFNLNNVGSVSEASISLKYAKGSESVTKVIAVDMSGVKLVDGLPTDDQAKAAVKAPLSTNSASESEYAKDYSLTVDMVSDNVIYTSVKASDVAYYKPVGGSGKGYYVGIAVPALGRDKDIVGDDAHTGIKVTYKQNDKDDSSDGAVNLTAVVSSGNLRAATDPEKAADGYKYDEKLDSRIAYFDASKVKKGYVFVTYTSDPDAKTGTPSINKTYKYVVDLSGVTSFSDRLPSAADASAFAAMKPMKQTLSANDYVIDQGDFSFTNRSGDAAGLLTISPNNSKEFPVFKVSEDQIKIDGSTWATYTKADGTTATLKRENGYWIGIGFPSYGRGTVSEDGKSDVTVAYKTGTSSENAIASGTTQTKEANYKKNVKIGDKYYDVFYFNAYTGDKDKYFFNVNYTNNDETARSISYNYCFDFSDVKAKTNLPADNGLGFEALKDTKGDVMPTVKIRGEATDPSSHVHTVSVDSADEKGLKAFTISNDSVIPNNKYWVAVAYPKYGTGSVSTNKAAGLSENGGLVYEFEGGIGTKNAPDVANYKAADGKWYDLFYVSVKDLPTDKKAILKVKYLNENGDEKTYVYHIDFTKVTFNDGLPTLKEVSGTGLDGYIRVADLVSENDAEGYRIGTVKTSSENNIITVSVDAASMKVSKPKGKSESFWAGVKIKAVSKNDAYTVTISSNNEGVHYDPTATTKDWNEFLFDLINTDAKDDGKAKVWVTYTSKTPGVSDSITFTYVINFSGVKKDLTPSDGLLNKAIEAYLKDKNGVRNPYDRHNATVNAAGKTVTPHKNYDVISVPATVTTTDLIYYVHENAEALGFGHYTGIALHKDLRNPNGATVTYAKGFGSFDPENTTFDARDSVSKFTQGTGDNVYDAVLFDMSSPDAADTGYVALKMELGGVVSYLVYNISFTVNTIKPKYAVTAVRNEDDKQILFTTSETAAGEKAIKVKFHVSGDKAPLAVGNVNFTVTGSGKSSVKSLKVDGGEDITTTKTAKTDTNGDVKVIMTLSQNAPIGVYTLNAMVGGKEIGNNGGGASYSVEVYGYDNTTANYTEVLDPVNDTKRAITPTYTLAEDSIYTTIYTVDTNGDCYPKNAVTYEYVDKSRITATANDNTLYWDDDHTSGTYRSWVESPLKLKQSIVSQNSTEPIDNQGATGGTDLTSGVYTIAAGTSLISAAVEQLSSYFYAPSDGNKYRYPSTEGLKLSYNPDSWIPWSFNGGSLENKGLQDSNSIVWTSTNENVAKVDEDDDFHDNPNLNSAVGLITKAAGTTNISATIKLGNGQTIKTTPVTVTVKPALDRWVISGNTVITELGKKYQYTAKYIEGANKGRSVPVEWSIGSHDKGSIDPKTGIYTADGIDHYVTVKAVAKDKQVHELEVDVCGYDSVETRVEPETIYFENVGDPERTVEPYFVVNNHEIPWYDLEVRKDVVSVNTVPADVVKAEVQNDGTIKLFPLKKGDAEVTVSLMSENKVKGIPAKVTVKVGEKPNKAKNIKIVAIDGSTDTLYVGEQTMFGCAVTAEDGKTVTNTTVSWNATGDISVDEKTGRVTAYPWITKQTSKGNKLIVYAIDTDDGDTVLSSNSIDITVMRRPEPTEFSLGITSTTLKAPLPGQKYGQSVAVSYKIGPADAQYMEIKWITEDRNVATVENGVITATGKGNTVIHAYLGTTGLHKTVDVHVDEPIDSKDYNEGYNANGAWIGVIVDPATESNYVYTGEQIKPEPNVYYGDVLLEKDKDYTYSYKNNTNAAMTKNKPTVVINLKGNYQGKIEKEFTIAPRSIEEAQANDISAKAKANKQGVYTVQTLKPVITYNGKTLKNDTDYELYYDADDSDKGAFAEPGTYPIRIVAKGNYTGTTYVDEVLLETNTTAVPASKVQITLTFDSDVKLVPGKKNEVYFDFGQTEGIVPEVAVTGVDAGDYSYTITNNKKPGTATVTVTGTGDKFYGSKKATFKIVKNVIDLSLKKPAAGQKELTVALDDGEDKVVTAGSTQKAPIDSGIKVTYAKGGAKPSSVVVKYNGEELVLGRDYTLSYTPGKAVGGNGYVTVKGKGYFKGNAVVSHGVEKQDIRKMTFVVDDFVATAKNMGNYAKNFKATVYDLDGKTLKGNANAAKSGIDYSYVVQPLSTVGYGEEVTVTITGQGNYEGENDVTFRIIDDNQIKSLKKAKYDFIGKDDNGIRLTDEYGNPEIVKANKYYQKYAGYPIYTQQDDLVVRVNRKVGLTNHWEVLDDNDYEIVNWQNNNKVGTATVTIRGLGDYGGLCSIKVKIKK